jgi:quaternary ammonium compound-resistance protein SugE
VQIESAPTIATRRFSAKMRSPAGADIERLAMAWLIVIVAGLFEVGWAIGLKYTDGFTRVGPTVATLAAMVVSVWLLSIGMRTLPVGTAYSVWVGVGAIGTVALGIVLFGEPASAARLISVGLIVAGIVGLKLAG